MHQALLSLGAYWRKTVCSLSILRSQHTIAPSAHCVGHISSEASDNSIIDEPISSSYLLPVTLPPLSHDPALISLPSADASHLQSLRTTRWLAAGTR